MVTVSPSARHTTGLALIAGGGLFLLSALLPFADVSIPLLVLVAYVAMVVALSALAVGVVRNAVAKVSLLTGAVGFAILVLNALLPGGPTLIAVVGIFCAALGFLMGALAAWAAHEATTTAAVVLVIAAVLSAVSLLGGLGALLSQPWAAVTTVAHGAVVVASGALTLRSKSPRLRA